MYVACYFVRFCVGGGRERRAGVCGGALEDLGVWNRAH